MDNSYIVCKTYSHQHQAEMDLNKLKNEGIKAYLSDKNMGSFSFLGAATGGVKMHVAEKDIKRVQEVLSNNQSS